MALELVAAIVAAIAFAGIGLMLRKLSQGRFPKWAVTVAAAIGLIGTTVWLEYDWLRRVSAELPPGFTIVDAEAQANPLRPWTYLAPITTRFAALDRSKIARHPTRPELVIAPVYGFARWQSPRNGLMVFDCAGGRRVMVAEGMEIAADGTLSGAEWTIVETEDELQRAACQEG